MLPGSPRARVVALLGVLALVWLPRTLQDDVNGLRRAERLSPLARADERGPAATAGSDPALVRAAALRIPSHASFAIVRNGSRSTDAFAREAGRSWTQFELAPRVEVAPGDASWLLIRDASPASLGRWSVVRRNVVERWRFGADWLVHVR